MKTIHDIDVAGKTVLLRADYNVPLKDGRISDDYRITQSLPTLDYLLEHDCRIVIISHLGRPEGKPTPEFSLALVAEHLQKLIEQPVVLAADFAEVDSGKNQITMLENLRFWPGEEANEVGFAGKLASLGEIFVQDGFGVVHRAHASTEAITKLLPSVAGLLLEREVTTINKAMENPKRPLVAILGGAKVSDKIELIERFIDVADTIIIGGAMANTFLSYEGREVGKSFVEPNQEEKIKQIYVALSRRIARDRERGLDRSPAKYWILPEYDTVGVAKDTKPNSPRCDKLMGEDEISPDELILDIDFVHEFKNLGQIGTVIWNGPIGMTELPAFRTGSKNLADAILESGATSIVGGGDTAAFVDEAGLLQKFDHVSTGGGAALELMAGKVLPGVAALEQ